MALLKINILLVENVHGELMAYRLLMGIFGLYPYKVLNGVEAIAE